MIHIYDANAYLRQNLNRHDPVGTSPRFVYEAANAARVPQIWIWDGPRNNERRRAIFAGYKLRDYTGQENIFAGLDLYRQLLELSRAIQITVPDYEADDVCATIGKHYADQSMPVTIYTNDFDFHQLTVHPLITIKGTRPHDNVPAQFVPLYKAMCGDASDKIGGIPGFGPKAWESFRELWPTLDQALRTRDGTTVRAQPFTNKPMLWLASDENMDLLFDYYAITHMIDVPMELIEKHTKVGQPDPVAAQSIFSRFMI